MSTTPAIGRPVRSRGVSLIEALAALAVMAFGILGVVGVQATLRGNADISRQRAEAVRIAQQAIEQARGFTTIPTTAGQVAYDDIVTSAATDVSDPTYNTTYSLSTTVTPSGWSRSKAIVASVSWVDRTGTAQSVSLSTFVAGIAPDFAGAMTIPGDSSAAQQAGGRNSAIPAAAVDQGNGTSNFSPPGAPAITWVFNNLSGLITSICDPTCAPANAFLLAGHVLYSTGGPPSASNPTSVPVATGIGVTVTSPSGVTPGCYTQTVPAIPSYVDYYCAIPIPAPPATQAWSGQSLLSIASLSASLSDVTASHYKVCRYTPQLTDTPSGGNFAHPLNYSNVTEALANQNFLVISAGNGTSAYTCPTDGTNTYRHQPTS